MLRRRLTVAVLALTWALVTAPSAQSAAPTVHITARLRPKVAVTLSDTGGRQTLLVKANVSWTIITSGTGPQGTFIGAFEGRRTSDDGMTLRPPGHVTGFTALANP